MWVTTKSIVKEIKKKQEDLAEKLDIFAMEQKESSSTLKQQIEAISSRLESLEKSSRDESENIRNQFEVLIRGLEELKQLIEEAQGQICNMADGHTQAIISKIAAAGEKETDTLLGQINSSADKVCGIVNSRTDKYEHLLKEEIESVKGKSDTDRKQCITTLLDAINEKIEQLEKEVSDKSNDVVLETRKCSTDIARKIETLGGTIQSVSSVAASKDAVMSDNIETMNHAMQEIMQNLMSLDEGNRLIIAKLLLKDMEI